MNHIDKFIGYNRIAKFIRANGFEPLVHDHGVSFWLDWTSRNDEHGYDLITVQSMVEARRELGY